MRQVYFLLAPEAPLRGYFFYNCDKILDICTNISYYICTNKIKGVKNVSKDRSSNR